ncbi:MAG: calcium-binding protein, partial [Actinobacteria bacterium]
MNASKKPRRLPFLLGVVFLVTTGPVFAATIVGTPKNEVLRGTAMADKLYGGRGNDKRYGLAGNDLLVGGPGDDLLVGGPGRDTMQCGPGRDAVVATKGDNVAVDCEVLKGLPAPALSIGDAAAAEGGRRRVDHDVYGAPVG